MRTLYKIAFLLLGATVSTNMAFSQIYSNTADAVKNIAYKSYTGNDKLFAFYQTNGSFHPGELTADGPTVGLFDFVWTKYDEVAHTFSIPVKSESDVNSSTIGNLDEGGYIVDEGGYLVKITNGADIDTSFIAWVMLDELKVWNLKDALGHVPSYRSNCAEGNQLSLTGFVEVDSFYYYDPITFDSIFFENDFNIEWTCDNPEHFIPNSTNKNAIALNTDYNPPIEDTWYILSATDSLGMTEIDSVFFDSPFTEARFSVSYFNKDGDPGNSWPDESSVFTDQLETLDAPLSVQFTNESIGGTLFQWYLLDTTNKTSLERNWVMEESENLDYKPVFTYETADRTFHPYLVSYNVEQGNCRDTFQLEGGITIAPSELMIPNVFAPDSETETNRIFKFKHQSILSFSITIISRTGTIVYKEDVNDIYAWEGWDGTIRGNGRKAPTGQYYYIISGIGYDDAVYKDATLWEQFKNSRENGQGILGSLAGGSGTTATDPDNEIGEGVTQYTGWVYLFRGSNY